MMGVFKLSSEASCNRKYHILSAALTFFLLFVPFSTAFSQQKYFQQRVDYKIEVKLEDTKHLLHADIKIVYTNNSPDTLQFIWFHLWPNAYKDRTSALSKQQLENGRSSLYFAPDSLRGYIDSLDFRIDGVQVTQIPDAVNKDVCKLPLQKPLLPGGTTVITTPFRVKIPDGKYSRLGHIGESYFISQWYPKPAVYDKTGWHPMPYLDQGEFYSEFGSFEVAITLPENYVVASTGILQETSETNWLKKKAEETVSMNEFGSDNSFPVSATNLKKITFRQDSIHDFAWFADKRFHVLRDEVIMPGSKKKVETWVYFTNDNASLWSKSIKFVNDAILFYSQAVGEYPYAHYSVIDGTISAGSGMEYPMITIIGDISNDHMLNSVFAHEIGHSWFYGILATNERIFGWMDEGINSFYELEYMNSQYPGELSIGKSELNTGGAASKITGLSDISIKDGYDITYKLSSFGNSDQPIITPSTEFTYFNYGSVVYRKSALAFDFLKKYLGDEVFEKAMKSYYEEWKFKHPYPEDFRKEFEKSTGKNLSWFFDYLLSSNRPVDYKIMSTSYRDGSYQLLIRNRKKIPVPFYLNTLENQGIWVEGFVGDREISLPAQPTGKLYINKEFKTLLKSKTTSYKTDAAFHSCKRVKLAALPKFNESPEINYLYLLPAVGWNRYNSWMGGLYFSNVGYIPVPFEFSLVPLYDFKNKEIAGLGTLSYQIWPLTGAFSNVNFSVKVRRFGYDVNDDEEYSDDPDIFTYSKLEPGVDFTFRKKTPRSKIEHALGLRSINLWQDEIVPVQSAEEYSSEIVSTYLNFNEISYRITNSRLLDPYAIKFTLENGSDHLKLYGEFKYRLSYAKTKKGVDFRLFAGGFLVNKNDVRNYNFRMSGWQGSQDYLYDELYFGRTDDHGLWDNQFVVRDGGFKIPTFVGQSNQWIAALNVSADLPLPVPVSVFLDLGTYEGINTVFEDIDNLVMYDAGICISPVKGVFEIYIPLLYSKDIEKNLETNDFKFIDKVRFVFNLNKLAPVRLRNSVYKAFE